AESILAKFDTARMEQVLNNLITNAIKYSKPESSAVINIRLENSVVRVIIQDYGVGIPANEMDKLFKPFSKTSATTTAGESSTGLGLFTCKKIIDAHKGEIGAHSVEGTGSTFYFTLPLIPYQETTKNIDKTENEDYNQILFGKNILVVDDNNINISYFKEILNKFPVKVDCTQSGKDSIELVKANHYDLVLMDIHMPDLDGLEATRIIRTFNKDIPIICQTAYVLDGMREKCIQAGCNDYMGMPVKRKEVIEGIVRNL
ncbi:MAG: response regulator, partial [Draconibacterium sp.]|nr:response regulator [Draconibacterium sp.]